MNNPSKILKEKVIRILEQIDAFLDSVLLNEQNGNFSAKDGIYTINNFNNFDFTVLKTNEDFEIVSSFLKSKGIDFKMYNNRSFTKNERGMTELTGSIYATIKGASAESLKNKINKLIDEMSQAHGSVSKKLKDYNIIFSKTGNLFFDDVPLPLAEKEAVFVSYLLDHPKNEKISWDEIYGVISGDGKELVLTKTEEESAKSSINSIYNRITKKIKDFLNLQDELLFFRKNSEYWYEIDINKDQTIPE